ncbi:MAG: hypothetical protein ACHP6H_06490 [Legionellales bacterium]
MGIYNSINGTDPEFGGARNISTILVPGNTMLQAQEVMMGFLFCFTALLFIATVAW